MRTLIGRMATWYSSQSLLGGLLFVRNAGTATVTLPGYPSGSFGGVPAGWSMASNFTRTRLLFQKHGSKMLSAENWAWRMGENIE